MGFLHPVAGDVPVMRQYPGLFGSIGIHLLNRLRDLAMELALPVVIASSPGLGAINHALLTIEAARAAGLRVAGVVLTPWPAEPDEIEG